MIFKEQISIYVVFRINEVSRQPAIHRAEPVFSPHGSVAIKGRDLVIIETSRSHWKASHSVEVLWTSDQPDAENCTRQHTTCTRDRLPSFRWNSNPQPSKPTPQTAWTPVAAESLLPETLRRNCNEIVTKLQIIICWRNFRNTVLNRRQIWTGYVLLGIRENSYRCGRNLLLHFFIEITINMIFDQEFGFYQMHTKFHPSTSSP